MFIKKRNFTTQERKLLVEILKSYKDIVNNKKTDAINAELKKKTWVKISQKYNSSDLITESARPEQLRRLWQNMKTRQRGYLSKECHCRLANACKEVYVVPDTDVTKNLMVEIEYSEDSDEKEHSFKEPLMTESGAETGSTEERVPTAQSPTQPDTKSSHRKSSDSQISNFQSLDSPPAHRQSSHSPLAHRQSSHSPPQNRQSLHEIKIENKGGKEVDNEDFDRNTVTEIKKENEGGSEEDNEEDDCINIKKEKEDYSDLRQEQSLIITESHPPLSQATPVKNIVKKKTLVILKKIDVGTSATKRTLNWQIYVQFQEIWKKLTNAKQSQKAITMMRVNQTHGVDYKYTIGEAYQLECKQFERNTMEEIKRQNEVLSEEDNKEEFETNAVAEIKKDNQRSEEDSEEEFERNTVVEIKKEHQGIRAENIEEDFERNTVEEIKNEHKGESEEDNDEEFESNTVAEIKKENEVGSDKDNEEENCINIKKEKEDSSQEENLDNDVTDVESGPPAGDNMVLKETGVITFKNIDIGTPAIKRELNAAPLKVKKLSSRKQLSTQNL
ncbi:hypothetical protein K1T71_000571 [Dendrolimus kikuchii]|uniref:Uncharacterized protein n=1 Tax=Dendrolimus kikuchii TaxID=765133 RepID=A0ACC1DJK9_9NEOP|nr:hypothetical protein K1T71_000571 [Dendrolimus kikuchii]